MPPPPEIGDRIRDIRIIEVDKEFKAEQPPQANGHIGITGEIKIQLQGVGRNAHPSGQRAILHLQMLPQSAHLIGQQHLFGKTHHKQPDAGSKHGKRLSIDQFELDDTQTGDWKIGMRPVMTKLWEGKIVYAFLTSPKKGNGKKRLFLCTKNPQDIQVCWNNCDNETIYAYGKENKNYLPIGLYSLRWNIEVSYYEEKTFWSLENYHVRSSCGIERLVNLQSIAYSAMTLLPYSDETFAGYKSASAQDIKYEISQEIQTLIILCSFGKFLETVKNSSMLIKHVENYVLSGIRKFQKL